MWNMLEFICIFEKKTFLLKIEQRNVRNAFTNVVYQTICSAENKKGLCYNRDF